MNLLAHEPLRFTAALALGACLGSGATAALPPNIKPDIVVAADGSGNFTSVQAALDSIPTANTERTIVFIKNGDYNERVRIEKSFVTLLGEDRRRTRLVWQLVADPNAKADMRAATNLVLTNASDIVIDNLTIENPSASKNRPFVISSSGSGTRIVIQNAEILSQGGDTLSLWTRGLYYHRSIHVTGTYHFVGPRGTCYLRDSLLECLGPVSNALFNEGMDDEKQKFVLFRCQLISKVPFGLGSNFRDAAWYFIDCQFPETLKPDGKIWIAQPNPKQPQPVSAMFKWATDRVYFARAKGPDYPWLKDNIEKSPAHTADTVTAAWTFSGEWDPESAQPPAIARVARAGDMISVTFAEPVTVKGQPRLVFADGKSGELQARSDVATLTFRAPGAAKPTRFDLREGAIFASQASTQLRAVADGAKLPE